MSDLEVQDAEECAPVVAPPQTLNSQLVRHINEIQDITETLMRHTDFIQLVEDEDLRLLADGPCSPELRTAYEAEIARRAPKETPP